MTDAEYEAQRTRIMALAGRWLQPLGLGQWTVHMEWVRGHFSTDRGSNASAVAECHVFWQYMSANIKWNLPLVLEQSDDELEAIFVHECMHIFLNETRESDLHHEERVATMLAKAFLWLRESLAT